MWILETIIIGIAYFVPLVLWFFTFLESFLLLIFYHSICRINVTTERKYSLESELQKRKRNSGKNKEVRKINKPSDFYNLSQIIFESNYQVTSIDPSVGPILFYPGENYTLIWAQWRNVPLVEVQFKISGYDKIGFQM